MTREDLNDGITGLRELVDSKLDRVIDKVEATNRGITAHAEAFARTTEEIRGSLEKEISRIDVVHTRFQRAIDGLQQYRWTMVGAFAVIVVLIKVAMNALFKI